jgi:SagB-type dehydrogenase family enzyme
VNDRRLLSPAETAVLDAATRIAPAKADARVAELAAKPAVPFDGAECGLFQPEDLAHASTAPSRPLADLLRERRSDSHLDPLDRRDLAALLYRAARTIDEGTGDDGGPWIHRPAPSAGGTHPFDLLVLAHDVSDLAPGAYCFAPWSVQLHRAIVPVAYIATLTAAVVAATRRATPPPAAIVLVANVERTYRRYPQGLTLLLRDAGALLAVLHLVATDLMLASTIVGTAGHRPDGPGAVDGEMPTVVDCGALALGKMAYHSPQLSADVSIAPD